MKKKTKYSMKHRVSKDHRLAWGKTIANCSPIGEVDLAMLSMPGESERCVNVRLTAMLKLQSSLDIVLDADASLEDHVWAHSYLASIFAILQARSIHIAGTDPARNPVLPLLTGCASAMNAGVRLLKAGQKLAFSPDEANCIRSCVDAYREVYMASSPKLMHDAFQVRMAELKAWAGASAGEGAGAEPKTNSTTQFAVYTP